MLERIRGYLLAREEPAPEASGLLESSGYVHVRSVFSAEEIARLASQISQVYDAYLPDNRAPKARTPEEAPARSSIWRSSSPYSR